MTTVRQATLFEENYLRRTHKTLTANPVVALTELVANAWDAGATQVDITIPDACGKEIIVSDNGCGLSVDEFHERWFKLAYDRLQHQGRKVVFPPDAGEGRTRIAFGRNGIGRHGMLCFNDRYEIISRKNGIEFSALIKSTPDNPIYEAKIRQCKVSDLQHGTTLKTNVQERLPSADDMLDALSARFVTDPAFQIAVNGSTVQLQDLAGLVETTYLEVQNVKIKLNFIDAEKALRKGIYHGIAFWQNKRLVGEPSWILGTEAVLDGRTTVAKRFIVIAESDDLGPYVREDWMGFEKSDIMSEIYTAVRDSVLATIGKINASNIAEIQESVKRNFGQRYSELNPLAKHQVTEAFNCIAAQHPTMGEEEYEIALETIAHLADERSGRELLRKISTLDASEVEALNKILDGWSLQDALSVLEEIDRRIATVEAIKRFSERLDTDEVHVLEPLITEARWLFGPEYDSVEYCANNQLKTIAKKIFHADDASFSNEKKRPDLFVVADSTFSLTGISEINDEVSQLTRILIVEIKKGAFKITQKEKFQTQTYVEEILGAGIGENLKVKAFVVGASVDPKASHHITVEEGAGVIRPVYYSQLVDTAERRLFNLRETLNDRYAEMSDKDVLVKAEQMQLSGVV